MAENSDLTEKTAIKTNLKPLGRSGTLVTGEVIQDEYLSELLGVAGQIVYGKMLRSDSQIRKVYHAVNNPIKSAKWDIEPASDEEKDLKVAALIKQILFKDIPGGFTGKLDEILTFPWHGHAIFEVIHENKNKKPFGPYTGLKNLAFRKQDTITKWQFEDGILKQIYQEQAGDIPVNAWLPIDILLIFFNEKLGDDSGYPFLRMLYGNYKRKLLYKQLQAIGIERAALPVPHLKVPNGVDPESNEWALAEEQLRAFTQAESAYFMMPDGYELNFNQTNAFDPGKVQVAIKAENEEIVGALVAMFLEMGIGGNSGNQAGTEVSAAFFRDGIEYLANKIKDVFNQELIPSLVRLNFGDTIEVMPQLTHDGITDQAGEELMRIITGYVEKGVVSVDEQLEDHVRKVHNLPKKALGEMLDNKKSENDTSNAISDSAISDNSASDTPDSSQDDVNNDQTKNLNFKPAGLSQVFDFASKDESVPLLMSASAKKISDVIRASLEFSGAKYINDTINRYKQLPDAKKQNATSTVAVGGSKKFKDALKVALAETASNAINAVKKEIPAAKNIELSSTEKDMLRLKEVYGDYSEIKLNENSKLPAYIQVLIAKQAELISEQSLADMQAKLAFTFSSIELKSKDIDIIKQNMEENLSDYVKSPQVVIKGENVSALMVNEGRSAVFNEPDVLETIHSYTFMNRAPKSAICQELAGTTFNTNDAESLRYTPPLHHNCKSYLRANLKVSKGVDRLEVKTLSPSPNAIKSMTL